MAEKKYQVFVSSTFRDLVEERRDTIRTILDMKHVPAGMELFPAADVDQLAYIKKVIDECDYYLLIVGGRYGSLDAEGISFTEREYDYAVEKGKFVIAFVHGAPGSISVDNSDIEPKLAEALKAFKDKVMSGRLIKAWTNRTDLQLAVFQSLMLAFSTYPQTGWIRGDAAASTDMLEQSNAILQENAQLRSEVAKLKAAQQPQFNNLAGLQDGVEIRFRTQHRSQYGSTYTYADRKISLKWLDIFIPLAGELTVPKTDYVVLSAIKKAMKEQRSEFNPYEVNDMDLAKIKAQFVALRLIAANVSETTKGGYAEFLSLTTHGKQAYMESIVDRIS